MSTPSNNKSTADSFSAARNEGDIFCLEPGTLIELPSDTKTIMFNLPQGLSEWWPSTSPRSAYPASALNITSKFILIIASKTTTGEVNGSTGIMRCSFIALSSNDGLCYLEIGQFTTNLGSKKVVGSILPRGLKVVNPVEEEGEV